MSLFEIKRGVFYANDDPYLEVKQRVESEIAILAKKIALLNALEHAGQANAGSVTGRIIADRPELRTQAKTVSQIAGREVSIVNQLTIEEQQSKLDREFPDFAEEENRRRKSIAQKDSAKKALLPPLPKATTGTVVTRFPPEPNGFMHIGHAKAAIIGHEYARMYDGIFILRFDDTNPAAEKREFYGTFIDALDWLGLVPNKIKRASDDMEKFYKIASRLIENNFAYVCGCTQEEIRNNRGLGKECRHRTNSTQENLSSWKDMLQGRVEKKESVLRFRGDMSSLNTTMRDPVLFRIVDEAHPLLGTKYKAWPTYDFDGPVEDSEDGVTHAMRSKEYELRDELYYAILDSTGLRRPEIIEFSRLSLQNTTVSKRSLRKLIDQGLVKGWDDPRLPTIFGLRKRGFLPQAIRDFVIQMGVSKVESEPTWDLLESINRKMLDPIARRFFFVRNPVRIEIDGSPVIKIQMRFHPDKDFGHRVIETRGSFMIDAADASELELGSKLRLIEAYDVEVLEKSNGKIRGRMTNEERASSAPRRIQWVTAEKNCEFDVIETGPLLLDGKFNEKSLITAKGVAEESAATLTEGDHIQFVRFGFCRVDGKQKAILTHR